MLIYIFLILSMQCSNKFKYALFQKTSVIIALKFWCASILRTLNFVLKIERPKVFANKLLSFIKHRMQKFNTRELQLQIDAKNADMFDNVNKNISGDIRKDIKIAVKLFLQQQTAKLRTGAESINGVKEIRDKT